MDWTTILICLVIGIVVAFIVALVLKAQLKSVHSKSGASDYVRPGSMVVMERSDLFLYRNVTRTAKPKDNK